ncbi:MAG: APC family permease [Gemmatimonadota bacterium]|nr:APC family permease [Gemmatimonadota bacterium]
MGDPASTPSTAPERATLERSVGTRQYFTLAFGTIIGVGWVIYLGQWLAPAGPLGAIIGFGAGTVLMLLVGLCYAEMAAALPVSGGELAYVYETFGTGLAFLTAWALAFVYMSTTAWEAISLSVLLENLLPGISGADLYSIGGSPIRIGGLVIGLVGIVMIGLLNYRGLRQAARFQEILTFTFLGLSVVFIGAGLIFGDVSNLAPALHVSGDGSVIAGIIAVMVSVPFFLAGFDAIPQAMEERSEATSARAAARMIVVALVAAGVFYVLVLLSASMASPWQELVAAERLPAAAAFEAAFDSPGFGRVVLIAGVLGLLTTWNAIFMAATRVLFALGRARMLPPVFATVHPKYESPSAAVLFVSGLSVLGLLLGTGAIRPLVNTSSFLLSISYALVCWGVIRLRRTRPDLDRPYRVPGGSVTAGLGLAAALGFAYLGAREPYQGADGIPLEWWLVLTAILLGAGFWVASRPFRGTVTEEERRALIVGE